MNRLEYFSLAMLGLILFTTVWSYVTYGGFVKAFFLPSPTAVLTAVMTLFTDGGLMTDVVASVLRILGGFFLSVLVSVPLGMMLGISRRFEAFTEPLVAFIRYIPPSAFIPLAIIWFGIGELEKISILFLGVAPYLTILIMDIVASTRREFVETALTLGANQKDLIFKVILPNALPGIWDSCRVMIGAAWTFVIIAEIVGASTGLGHLMIESQRFLRTDDIFAAILVIGLLGLLTDYLFKITYRIFFPWTEKSHARA